MLLEAVSPEKRASFVNATTAQGDSALLMASQDNRATLVRLLLNAGADVAMAHGNTLRTCLHQAAQKGHADMVRLLLVAAGDERQRLVERHL